MLALTRLLVFVLIVTIFMVQCSHADQLYEIQEHIDAIYDKTCLHCTRRGILDSMDG